MNINKTLTKIVRLDRTVLHESFLSVDNIKQFLKTLILSLYKIIMQ